MGFVGNYLKLDTETPVVELRACRSFLRAFFTHRWNKGWVCNYGDSPIPEAEVEEILSAIIEKREPSLPLDAVAEEELSHESENG